MKVRELIEALEALNIDQEREVFLVADDTRFSIREIGLYSDFDVYIEG